MLLMWKEKKTMQGSEKSFNKEKEIITMLNNKQSQGKYQLYASDIDAIRNISAGEWELICNAFNYGFIKGHRKAQADARKTK